MEKNQKKSGGQRDGAGKPLKYGEKTVMFFCRIPESKKDDVQNLVKNFIKKYEVKK